MSHSNGQTLLELTIGIGLAIIVVTALTIVTVNGLRNSQFSENQTRATKLAQDWLDQVRSFRDQNAGICPTIPSPNPSNWSGATGLFSTSCNGNCNYKISNSCLTIDSGSLGDSSISPFTRRISINDYNGVSTQKKVSITVSWNDFSGTHQSNLIEILGQP